MPTGDGGDGIQVVRVALSENDGHWLGNCQYFSFRRVLRNTYSSGITTSPLKGVALAGLDGAWKSGEGKLASSLSRGVGSEDSNADDGLEHVHVDGVGAKSGLGEILKWCLWVCLLIASRLECVR